MSLHTSRNKRSASDASAATSKTIHQQKTYNIDDYVDIQRWISELFARLATGNGIFLETKNKKLLRFWNVFQKKNNIDFVLENIAFEVAEKGRSIVTIDSYDRIGLDVRLTFASQAWVVRLSEEPIGVSVWKKPIVSDHLNYFIREVWTDALIKRYFFFNKQPITVGEFQMRLPQNINFRADNRQFTTKTDEKMGTSYLEMKNKIGIIPIVEFRRNRRKTPLFENAKHAQNWNTQINEILTEIQRDVIATKPRFIVSKARTGLGTELSDTDMDPTTVVNIVDGGRAEAQFSILQARERFNALADVLQKQLKTMLSLIGLSSDVSSTSPTTGTGEVKESATQNRTIRQFKRFLTFDLHSLFKKVFLVSGFQEKEIKFSVVLGDNTAETEQQLIFNETSKLAGGLASRAQSLAATRNQTDAEAKEDINSVEKPEVNTVENKNN